MEWDKKQINKYIKKKGAGVHVRHAPREKGEVGDAAPDQDRHDQPHTRVRRPGRMCVNTPSYNALAWQ